MIGWGNHPDYYEDFKLQPRPVSPTIQEGDKMVANPARKGELMTGNLPYSAGTTVHTADDVPLRAQGPGAEYFSGLLDNTEIFFGIVHALGLEVPIDEK